MAWRSAGADGEIFRALALKSPGWYWLHRPLNVGERAYDASIGLLIPIWVGPDGALSSPLAELQSLDDLACVDAAEGCTWVFHFAGPIAPGREEGALALVDGKLRGAPPTEEGWRWCRTEAPLQHVDDRGIGPVFLKRLVDGELWVFAASTIEGEAVDIWELGFSEPLVSELGLIDGEGEAGRTRAWFHGPIAVPEGLPAGFSRA